jgi:chemotaxis protein methyltransferase CheR
VLIRAAVGEKNLSERDFLAFQRMISEMAGIHLDESRRSLIMARLGKRLNELQLDSFRSYRAILESGKDLAERQRFVDLLTTNETYFFREPAHFELLRDRIAPEFLRSRKPLRVWSAACSTGEEAYSVAMVLADRLGKAFDWKIFGTDISQSVVEAARAGHYRMDRLDMMPKQYLRDYCLRGTGQYNGTLLVERSLRQSVSFERMNLAAPIADIGQFNVIFLRNMLIYFKPEKKHEIVRRVCHHLDADGWLIISHSESLRDMDDELVLVAPSVYRWRS